MHKNVKIVVVDDDEIDRKAILRAFTNARILNTVIMAENGFLALDLLRGVDGKPALEEPYVILLDLRMPRMDGLEFLSELRADPALYATRVIILSTSNDEQDKVKAYRMNVDGYLTKAQMAEDFSVFSRLFDEY